MTSEELIDHFAGLVLKGMMANSRNAFYEKWGDDDKELDMVVIFSYDMAVKMLKHKAELIEDGTIREDRTYD
jgi:hypothetical protein